MFGLLNVSNDLRTTSEVEFGFTGYKNRSEN